MTQMWVESSENVAETEETRLKGPFETSDYIQVRQIVP